MKVITENDIRDFIKKQIHSEGVFEIEPDMLLTPSAESYLREKKIPTRKKENKKNEPPVLKSVSSVNCAPFFSKLTQEISDKIETLQVEDKQTGFYLYFHHQVNQLMILMEELKMIASNENQSFYQEQLAFLTAFIQQDPPKKVEHKKVSDPMEGIQLKKIQCQINAILLLFWQYRYEGNILTEKVKADFLFFYEWQTQFLRQIYEEA